ncbi:MAG: F0F1 ATP synthase subunit epsilon [Spirochaeta sp.]
MRLKVMLPTQILVDASVTRIVVETGHGSHGILPRHINFVAGTVPGILSFTEESGNERFLALDTGVLVKNGDEVLVSARSGIRGTELGQLRQAVEEELLAESEREKREQSVLARLESDFARRFMEMDE